MTLVFQRRVDGEQQEQLKGNTMQKKILFDADTIARRVQELGAEISAKYAHENLLVVGVLKGCFVFVADLVRHLTCDCVVDFARIASYGAGTESSGHLKIITDILTDVKGKRVLLVDDIVDTGLTLSEYRQHLANQGPLSLEVAALIDKTSRREKYIALDYCGFRIESGFIVGYGLDCNEQYRHLPGLYILE